MMISPPLMGGAKLEGKIHERYGYAKDQVRKEVDNWLDAI
jgi:uncharacterized protein YjbJ (UPF0337 family)